VCNNAANLSLPFVRHHGEIAVLNRASHAFDPAGGLRTPFLHEKDYLIFHQADKLAYFSSPDASEDASGEEKYAILSA